MSESDDINPTQDDSGITSFEHTMAAASKETLPEDTELVKKPSAVADDDGIFSLIYNVAKRVAIVGSIYIVGYMGWSVAWLIAPVILSVAREQMRKTTDKKRSIAKASAMANEKDVIMARIDDLPAWVYFPDVERCEWLNKVLKQVWPNANYFARNLVKDTIEPNVALALANYKLPGFRFDRIILGTIPPRIGGVKVYDKNVDRNEIIMDLDLFYAGDCDINFYLGGMKGGIKDFQIHGWVRVIMKPLIRSMPLVGGLQIFFLNNPNIDFNLVGVIDLLDMPGLSDILRKVIVEQIAAIMVLPNKLPITLSDEVPAQILKMPEPEGVLRIHVVEAKDLMKKDISVLGKGKSDPYAVINVGAQEFKTQIIDNTVNPKWDFWCEAKVFAETGQFVDIALFDFDDASSDEKLGRATIEINKVIKKGVLDTWLTLEDAKHGLLHVRLHWCKLSAEPTDLQAALKETQQLRVTSMNTALLTVFMDSAKNLPQARHTSKPDPFLVISVGKQSLQTGVQLRTDSPVWEQGFTFLVSNPENDTLHLKLSDQKTGNDLGRFTFIIGQLLSKPNMEIVSQPFQLERSGPESKIVMSASLRILKSAETQEDTASVDGGSLHDNASLSRANSRTTAVADNVSLSRTNSVRTPASRTDISATISTDKTNPLDEQILSLSSSLSSATPPRSPLTNRFPSESSSPPSGECKLGRIQLTIQYSVQRQKLTVNVHRIVKIPQNDDIHNIPDPYVKLYLLPGRSKDSKRKTNVVKDNCNPVYDESFEYVISSAELMQSELEVTVCTQKGFLYGGSPVIGMLKINLADPDISLIGVSEWFDLQPESKHHHD